MRKLTKKSFPFLFRAGSTLSVWQDVYLRFSCPKLFFKRNRKKLFNFSKARLFSLFTTEQWIQLTVRKVAIRTWLSAMQRRAAWNLPWNEQKCSLAPLYVRNQDRNQLILS